MIYLDKKEYYTLEDLQGATFAQNCIFEGIEEVKDKFRDWNTNEDFEDFEKYTIADCLEIWQFTLRKWNGHNFEELEQNAKEFDFIK